MNAVTLYQRGLWEEAACFCFSGASWLEPLGLFLLANQFKANSGLCTENSLDYFRAELSEQLLRLNETSCAAAGSSSFSGKCGQFWEMFSVSKVLLNLWIGQWLSSPLFSKFSASGSSDCISGPAVQIPPSQSHPRRDVWLLSCANLRKEEGERGQPSADQEVCDQPAEWAFKRTWSTTCIKLNWHHGALLQKNCHCLKLDFKNAVLKITFLK